MSRRKELKKQKIILAALKILNKKKEYYKCPVDEIARAAGVAKGTVYLYFKDKEDLYFAVFFYMIEMLKAIADEVSKKKVSASRQIYIFLKRVDTFVENYKNIAVTLSPELKSTDSAYRREMNDRFGALIESVSKIIGKGIRAREFKKYPRALAESVLLSLVTIIAHRKIERGISLQEFSLKSIAEIFLKGIVVQ